MCILLNVIFCLDLLNFAFFFIHNILIKFLSSLIEIFILFLIVPKSDAVPKITLFYFPFHHVF